jgi:outer membrane protein
LAWQGAARVFVERSQKVNFFVKQATLLPSNALRGEGMKAFFWSSLLAVLCMAVPAQAQYANRSLGVSFGAFSFNADDMSAVRWGLMPALEGSLYIENGWDIGVQVPVMILFDSDTKRQYLSIITNFSFRYLFMEEYIRPYLGAQGGFSFHIQRKENNSWFGGNIGPIAGVDFFISESVSIGPRLFATFYLTLNEPVRYSFGGVVSVHTYF